MKAFASLGLSKFILQALSEQRYNKPSPIQQKAIPAVLAGRDVMAAAQTGTGKTAAFTLPMLELLFRKARTAEPLTGNHVRVLVLVPTRELAVQVEDSIRTYGEHLPFNSVVAYGGVSLNPQMMALRGGAEVLVATPGRLLDLFQKRAIKFYQLDMLVLDEADRMLDLGFRVEINKILQLLPKRRQNLLFSATFSDEIRALAKELLHHPVEIDVSPRNSAAKTVKQWIAPVDKKRKPDLLVELIGTHKWRQLLVFTKTKKGADILTKFLRSKGLQAAAIHGDKSQGVRTRCLQEFKDGQLDILVATDIAARGLDIEQLEVVVNFDLPNVAQDYVHRIGRTGRAGSAGLAVSLVSADEFEILTDIEYLQQKLLPRRLIDGFEPRHDVPVSELNHRAPKKIKKPKKPKVKSFEEKVAAQKAAKKAAAKKKKSAAPSKRKQRKAKLERAAKSHDSQADSAQGNSKAVSDKKAKPTSKSSKQTRPKLAPPK